MQSAWIRFASTGHPNAPGSTTWPACKRATDAHLEFGDAMTTGTRLHEQGRDVFEAWWRPQH